MYVQRKRSMASRAAPGSKAGNSTAGIPSWMAGRRSHPSPIACIICVIVKTVSPLSSMSSTTKRAASLNVRCVWVAPLGRAVLPEV